MGQSPFEMLIVTKVVKKFPALWYLKVLYLVHKGPPPYPRLCVKVKVNFSLCFSMTEHHTVKAYWGAGGITPLIL